MKLSAHSRNKLLETFKHWHVPKEFADPMYNYLVHGFSPGSCFTSVLANDFASAMLRSHPMNTVTAFKALSFWITDTVPSQAKGSYPAVNDWCDLEDVGRRAVLEDSNLIHSVDDEIMLVLSGTCTWEPELTY
jgi:hypothetical protein